MFLFTFSISENKGNVNVFYYKTLILIKHNLSLTVIL